jgi:hypothetical protein
MSAVEKGQDTDVKDLASMGIFLIKAAISGCKAYAWKGGQESDRVTFH